MHLYLQNYLDVFRRNFMLVAIALVLLAVTFPVWAGVPFFLVGSLVADIMFNHVIIYTSICLSGGFLFSLYFAPFNLKVAKKMASIKHRSVAVSFMYLQAGWIVGTSLVFAAALSVIHAFQL